MIKKDKKKKFPGVKSYKDLNDKKTNENYLDNLSLQILYTINEMKNLDFEYKKYEIKFSKDNISILNSSFNEIKKLLWTRFCIQIRDYSETIVFLLNESKSKCKYKAIYEYIKKTKFIWFFCKGEKDKEQYSAISLTLHNLNKYNYGNKKWNKSFKNFISFNKAIVENNIKDIQKEFETVIQKFRISEGLESVNKGLEYIEWSPLYKLMEFLLNLNKSLKYYLYLVI